ncbi:Semaphorin-4A Semaphorin-B [Triplophysa tibetana]|uniref:Semaphorin-4A Semaphorin-B n=1 Tax=Triplophysa tibetana TaxID=1572043 RepID=A0A5A9N0U0_9TELE|nr:Semaphorin-4A Semaphorin-B [Triplophysa tibetana]
MRVASVLKARVRMAGSLSNWIFTVFVVGLIDSLEASMRPRVSFPQGSLERGLSTYHSSTVKNLTTLLLSTDANTLFVGAQDSVLSLDISQPDNITLKDKDCGNFVRILQFFNTTHLYACGTNAYGPQSIIIPADSLNSMREQTEAKNCCPYSSTQRNTATIVDGELYTATNIGYFGDKVISRCLSKGTRNNLMLDTEPKLLNAPVFISSTHISSEGKILLFFTEVGDLIGDSFVKSFTVSRVAQVCTDDNGGHRVLQKRWTSFVKSQLVCQQGDELQFNVLEDIVTLSDDDSPDNTLFYGVFTPQWSFSSAQSAVCAFSLGDIKVAFSGQYKTFDNVNHWSHYSNGDGKLGKCGLFNDTDSVLNTVKKTFLTERAVHPVGNKLLLSSTKELYSRLAVQRIRAANGQKYTVLFLLTESGFLHKVVLLDKAPHIIEEIQIFKQPQIVKNLILSTSKGVIFIGSSEGVIRVPVSSCSVYPNCAECVLARDPFCGWDSEIGMCTTVSGSRPNLQQDVEDGNVTQQCTEFKNTAAGPATVTRTAQLNEIVVLPCQSRSRLDEVTWRFSDNSIVPQFPYLHQADHSLTFRVTQETVSTYRCVSEELGFRQTIVSFSVKLPVTPRSFTHPSHEHPDVTQDSSKVTDMEPIPKDDILFDETEPTEGKKTTAWTTGTDRGNVIQARHNPMNSAEKAVCISEKSYYAEMVAFCLLFIMCACLFIAFVVLWKHSMRCNRTTPEKNPKDTETDNICQTELEDKQTPNS